MGVHTGKTGYHVVVEAIVIRANGKIENYGEIVNTKKTGIASKLARKTRRFLAQNGLKTLR